MEVFLKISRRFYLYFMLSLLSSLPLLGQQGSDGASTTIINTYTNLTVNANAGSTSITVGSATGIATGDLLMLIQMQGAAINTTNDVNWGSIKNYGSSGLNEFVEVNSVSGNTINIKCGSGIKNNYSVAGKTQVIKVPRYSSLSIASGVTLTGPAWNGTNGGILVAEVLGDITINGTIDMTGKGFRGGIKMDDITNYSRNNCIDWAFTDFDHGGEKGESIAGFGTNYDASAYGGQYGMGAPANGGGGGNCHNAAGGGGSNAGILANYNGGNGNPDVSNAAWLPMWRLEYPTITAAGFNNSGGGKGGPSYSDNEDPSFPSTVPLGDTRWGGDYRRAVGGRGGKPLDYSGGRLFLGGGGGSGHCSDADAGVPRGGSGGIGGGMVYLISCGKVLGNGRVLANGTNGGSTVPPYGNDGAGGAGGGGTIVVNATGGVGGVILRAEGGVGGNFSIDNQFEESPGGGGGGGYVAITTGNPNVSVKGGANGVDLLNNPRPDKSVSVFDAFTPKNATAGGAGLFTTDCNLVVSICGVTLCSTKCTLPIEWINFTVDIIREVHVLNWTVSTKESRFFIIERSKNGVDFEEIGLLNSSISSSGIQSYHYEDKYPIEGINYYRLKEVGSTNQYNYSRTISINKRLEESITIHPNPNTGKFTVSITSDETLDYSHITLDIIDMGGKVVYSNDQLWVPLNIELGNIPRGVYLVRLYLDSSTNTQRLMVY